MTPIELSDQEVGLARANFRRSGRAGWITLVHDEAARGLERSADGSFTLVFLDLERSEDPRWWPDLKRVLRPGGRLVVDHAIPREPVQLAPIDALAADLAFTTSIVPVGKGEFLAVKDAGGSHIGRDATCPGRTEVS